MNEDSEHKSCGLRVRCQLRKGAIELSVAVGRTIFAARFYAGGTNPASGSLQRQGEVERLNHKSMFEVKTVRPGALGPGVEVELVAILAPREIDEPLQHFAAKTAAARRLFRDQVIDVKELTPRETVQDAEASAADALAFMLEISEAIPRLLLPLDAGQE
jgi:hypothetical protein